LKHFIYKCLFGLLGAVLLLCLFAFNGSGTAGTISENTTTTTDSASTEGSSYTYTIIEMPFDYDGGTIFGQIYLPDTGKDRVPTVIISHGFQARYFYNGDYADALAKAGYAVYLFDFTGGSMESASGGSMTDMSILTEKADLERVIDFISTQSFVDTDNLFLFGESQGGLVTAITAPEYQDKLNGLILLYPAFNITSICRSPLLSSSMICDSNTFDGATVSRKYFDDARTVDSYQIISSFNKDVLILQGDRDTMVPIAYVKTAAEIYPHCDYQVIQGAGHGFNGAERTEAMNLIVQFVSSHIK
jgi:pimeloyl-ACP methyl ester carboxylesterase